MIILKDGDSANAMVVNAGGVFAFYPTKLDCQKQAPSLTGDLFGGILDKGVMEKYAVSAGTRPGDRHYLCNLDNSLSAYATMRS